MIDVVLPCLDEAAALPWVLGRMPHGYRAIVADNGSTDGSARIAAEHGAHVVHEPRRGFGAACHAGLLAATADIVCFMDADGSLDPAELPGLVALLATPVGPLTDVADPVDPARPGDVTHLAADLAGPGGAVDRDHVAAPRSLAGAGDRAASGGPALPGRAGTDGAGGMRGTERTGGTLRIGGIRRTDGTGRTGSSAGRTGGTGRTGNAGGTGGPGSTGSAGSTAGADLVLGRRRPVSRRAWPPHARLGNAVIARRVGLRDIGPMRVARREDLLGLRLTDRRSGYPLEMVLRAARSGWRITETDVTYRPRTGRSKVTGTVRGTLQAVRDMRKVLSTP
jgi:glycosyltransferase involved in cell wall biosynthesis